MRPFQRTLAEEDSIVGDDADGISPDVGETANQGQAVQFLEFVELGAVDHAGDDVTHVKRFAPVNRNHAIDVFRCKQRLARLAHVQGRARGLLQSGDDAARNTDRMTVVLCVVIGDAGLARMHVSTAEFFRRNHLARGGLHQWRSAEKNRALIANDNALIRHCRHIGSPGSAGAHYDRDLWDPQGGHLCLIVEDTPKMPFVREDLILHRQEGAAGIDHVDARQIILPRDILGPKMFFYSQRIIGATLDGRVIGYNDAFAT